MRGRGVRIWIAVVAGLALAVLLVLAGSASASPYPPERPVTWSRAANGTAVWSSPWVPINQGQMITFTHGLGQDPDDYGVELTFLDTNNGLGINRSSYGGLEVGGSWFGAHWQGLTPNTIQVYRQSNDQVADLIRVRVWLLPSEPDYDSGWKDISQNEAITLHHNVGVTPTELTVGLWFSGTARGVHQFAYGGLAVDGPHLMLGAHWQSLTTDTIQVLRHPHDTDVEQVRVLVVEANPPDYDSDWQDFEGTTLIPLTHDLSWNPNMLLVRAECYDTSGMRGIHQLFAGGNHSWLEGGGFQGMHWQELTTNTVTLIRRSGDEFCSQARIRIWKRSVQIYLPLVLRNAD